jgi:signal transduction histidine kinase
MHRYNILIIDDDEDDYLIVRSLLEEISKQPVKLDWASSYSMGEKLLSENRHSVCLLDYKLGARNGIELLKISNQIGFTGPIILLTGVYQPEIDTQALEAGAVDYLVKENLTSQQLARSIRYALGRREMELERVERLRAEAENRSKSEFLAHLSHELRTPLSAILGFTELLLNSEQSEENHLHASVIHRNGKHLLGLLNDILDLSKIEAGKLDLSIQPISFIAFMADVYSLMSAAATDKNLTFRLSAPEPLPQTIFSDPIRLRQVLLNLIGNAIKFTNEGSVDVSISVQQTAQKEFIVFDIKDTGIGIADTNLKAIFEPFVQIKNSLIQTRTGSGLGLAISRKLVEHLGGKISVSSEAGCGSNFNFTIDPGDLSQVKRRELSLESVNEFSGLRKPPQFAGRILVVDDLRDIRALVGHYVARCGLKVDFAGNGLEAINKLMDAKSSHQEFDLVLMDVHMPIKDGITAAKEMRDLGFTIPLIALTAAHMKGDEDLYLKAGFNLSLSKPIDQAQLVYVLGQFLTESVMAPTNEIQTKIDSDSNTILVVEDSEDALTAMKGIMELLGWVPLLASSARDAIELTESHKPGFALVDINLPDSDGYTLSKTLSETNPDIHIFLTSGAEFEPARTCPAIKGHLLKPIGIAELHRLLKDFE